VIAGVLFCAWALIAAQVPAVEDPALKAAVERFYETQEKEDIAGYLSLWSAAAKRPPEAQLKYIFDNGDDKFSEIQITRAVPAGSRIRLRVDVRRERTLPPRVPGGSPFVTNVVIHAALTFEKVGEEWKLVREGSAEDDLAAEIVAASTEAERDALLAAEPELMGPALVSAFARVAGAAAAASDYARAQAVFELTVAIAHRGGLKKEEGEALQNVANAAYFRRRLPEALDAYERRLVLERERGDEAGVASALGGIATIRYSFAEYTEALARYREALALHEKLDDVVGIAFAELSIGNITYLQGDFQTAITSYRRALDLNRTMSSADGESRALEGLGLVFTAQGDYLAALESFDAVLKDPRMRSLRGRLGAVAQSTGDVHFRLGNLDAARAIYEESRAHFESQRDMPNVGRVLQSIALTELVAARFLQAEDLYKRSGGICTAADDKECSARATAGFAYTQAAQEKFFDAAASYRKAIAEFTALDRREDAARSEVGLSQALAGAEDFAGAIDAAIRARQAAVVLESDDVLWRALTAEARAIRRNGDKDRALGIARAAVVTLERMQAHVTDKPGASIPADAAAAFATFAVLQAEAGDAAGAFATSERLHSLDIRASLATNERDIARGMTSAERDEERDLAAQVLTRLAQLTRERGLPKPDTARIAMLEKAVAAASDTRRAWIERLFERLPELRVWRGLAPSRTSADAAPLLEADGTVLVSFVLDDEDLLVLTATRRQTTSPDAEGKPPGAGESPATPVQDGGVSQPVPAPPAVAVEAHLTPVKRRDVAERVLALQQPAVLNDLAAWRKGVADLLALVPQPVVARLATASKVIVIPHDVLWRVPFDALPSGRELLIDRATITVAGSLDSLLRSSVPATGSTDPVVAVGRPRIESARLDRLKQVAPSWSVRTSETADAEMKGIAEAYLPDRAVFLTEEGATESAVRSRAADAAVLHFATPFRINAASPLFSPILLATPESSETTPPVPTSTPAPASPAPATPAKKDLAEDGTLELREIMNLTLRARLAVLSDGTAAAMRDAAAAADVVQWGWLASGVPAVVLSRWTTPLASKDRLLEEFYKRLSSGATPADALHGAQLALRGASETSAPVHWAGWMLLGR
jgi:CHAT domain-containing protein/tetratricopeptide (TPR) repeat protein